MTTEVTRQARKLSRAGRLASALGIIFLISLVVAETGYSGLAIAARPTTSKSNNMINQGKVRAPELKGGAGWFNTDKPITMAALRGKVVLLDFWTYCCINCMHVIPDLKRLEHKYPNELVVIGVHSAKFTTEKESENIQQAILRYGIEHPVVNDNEFNIWHAYTVNSWPTFVLIDPDGYVVGKQPGEGVYDILDQAISQTIQQARATGKLNETPLKLTLERAKFADTPLLYPGKVLADAASKRLFIADSNHNRIVIAGFDGKLIETVGSGQIGQDDGSFATATFNRPQGMALDGDSLYVADTENHLIRRLDLKSRQVETIAGTGAQADRTYGAGQSDEARKVPLNSPWDLQLVGRRLFIAMAGPHQVWLLDLDKRQVGPFAGNGNERRLDGSLTESSFAQPSGITTDGKRLFTADSEISSVRSIDLGRGQVQTLVGGDLFQFGDRDGVGDDVRLQHPLGVTYYDHALYLADTYNHKIKRISISDQRSESWDGIGKPGFKDGKSPQFYEPGGLSIADGKMYVADTNNHAIRVIDLKSRQASTLTIVGLKPVVEPKMTAEFLPNLSRVDSPAQTVQAGQKGEVVLNVQLPTGYHLNPETPHRYRLEVKSGDNILNINQADREHTAKDLKLPVRIPYTAQSAGHAELTATLTLYYCRDDNQGACRIKSIDWHLPVEIVAQQGASSITASFKLE